MKALILAAGFGSRLAPLTDNLPKSLVCVNGTPILFRQIESLVKNNVREITIVSGYLSEILKSYVLSKYPFVRIIENTVYEKTNNMYSAYLARDVFCDELLMMNADVFFDSSIITELLTCENGNAIATDKGKYNDESMKIEFDGNSITSISKTISKDKAYGVSIDVYKFSPKGAKTFYNICCNYIESRNEKELWSEVALNDTLKEICFIPCDINGRWYEIDNFEDLNMAEELFA